MQWIELLPCCTAVPHVCIPMCLSCSDPTERADRRTSKSKCKWQQATLCTERVFHQNIAGFSVEFIESSFCVTRARDTTSIKAQPQARDTPQLGTRCVTARRRRKNEIRIGKSDPQNVTDHGSAQLPYNRPCGAHGCGRCTRADFGYISCSSSPRSTAKPQRAHPKDLHVRFRHAQPSQFTPAC